MAHTRVYYKGELEAEGFPVADVSDHVAREGTLVWVDVCNPTPEQMAELADEFGLHELAVEDALGAAPASEDRPLRRPPVPRLPRTRLNEDVGELETTEIDAFISDRWMITVRKDDGFDIEARHPSGADRSEELVAHGVSFLVYGLLDVVVDGYFDTVDRLRRLLRLRQRGAVQRAPDGASQSQRHWFQMRQSLIKFHRIAVPMRRGSQRTDASRAAR